MIPTVAVVADPHFHDTSHRPGVGHWPGAAFRTLADTAASTRVFNESFAAFPALLDDIVAAAGIRHVVIAGDLTDDGQEATCRGRRAARRLSSTGTGCGSSRRPAITTSTRSHGRHQSKRFLNPDGSHTLVTSDPDAPQDGSAERW